MAKAGPTFACRDCGAVHAKWAGRCDACGAWNSIEEQAALSAAGPKGGKTLGAQRGTAVPLVALSGEDEQPPRISAGVAELDRVLGGGLVPASAVLIGGDPGIGKSTLLLQAAAAYAHAGAKVIYVSGEEATAQIRLRAARLGLSDSAVLLAAETNLRDILTTLDAEKPDVAIIDSIQTMWLDSVESAPGSVSQVRGAAHELTSFAKRRGTAVIMVGHVTKDGQIAGPRVVEHMVDATLYFEGDGARAFRILRSVKNRFGPAAEIGVFEMTGAGLREVANPSALFLSDREKGVSGSVVFAGLEGSRPMLCEIQALVADSPLGTPRRAVVGCDSARMAMILAVLDARCGVSFAQMDVHLNVAGGLRINEPAADLAVAAALVSALRDRPVPDQSVIFGELSLSGAVRPAPQPDLRLREAAKLGFDAAFVPSQVKTREKSGMRVTRIEDLAALLDTAFDAG